MISIERHSPSSLNRFASSPAMYVLERILGLKQPVSPQAHRGVAVEDGVALGLSNHDSTIEDCVDVAYTKYDTLTAMSGDSRREKVREGIHNMILLTLDELRPYGKPSKTQGFIEWKPDGLKFPIVGYYDFFWEDKGIVIDLKTTDKMPSEITIPHAMQVAFYAMSDNMDARLTYCTPKKCQTYQLENIREHREALLQMALRVERFLSLSDDPEFFKSITVPDLGHYLWNNPAARQLAWEHWRI
jgi:PD-(D/E)XK nuclease superfamily